MSFEDLYSAATLDTNEMSTYVSARGNDPDLKAVSLLMSRPIRQNFDVSCLASALVDVEL